MQHLVIGIAGGSGSGKSTLVNSLVQEFGEYITVLSHDSYYRRHDEMSMEERAQINYDHPDAYETDLLLTHLKKLRSGQAIDCPTYDFTVHNRTDELQHIEPKPVILLEGILIFAEPRLCEKMDVRVFVDADADVRLLRRIRRDVRKRARTLESVIEQYQKTVKPMYEKYVEPSKKNANIIVPEGGKNLVAIEMLRNHIRRYLHENVDNFTE